MRGSINQKMSTRPVRPAARQARDFAWLRIKMLVGWMLKLLSLILGSILVLFASVGLLGVLVSLVFGQVHLGRVMVGVPALNIDGYRIDCTTWWGVLMLVLFNLLVLAWGRDFVRMGRGMRSASA